MFPGTFPVLAQFIYDASHDEDLRRRTCRRFGLGDDMRPSICATTMFFALLTASSCALAETITLAEPVELRAQPGARRRVVATAPAGAELSVLGAGRDFAPVSYDGRRLYAPTAQLVAATPSAAPGSDPTCDYGYPYSGSGQFFARPLARLRHGEPLGFLFGYHRFYPC
jgi:hypothetical protein